MKKILLALAAAFSIQAVGFAGSNDSFILSKIESSNETVKSLTATFTADRTVTASGLKSTGNGDLYFTPGRLSMLYNTPAGEYFIINGNQMSMNRNGRKAVYDLTKTPMMSGLSKMLLCSIQGKVRTLAVDVNADIAVSETSSSYVVTLTAKKKEVKGYAKIVITYSKTGCIIQSLETDEFSGVVTVYTMAGTKKNAAIDDGKFLVK